MTSTHQEPAASASAELTTSDPAFAASAHVEARIQDSFPDLQPDALLAMTSAAKLYQSFHDDKERQAEALQAVTAADVTNIDGHLDVLAENLSDAEFKRVIVQRRAWVDMGNNAWTLSEFNSRVRGVVSEGKLTDSIEASQAR